MKMVQDSCAGIAAMISCKANQFDSMHSRGDTINNMFDLGLHQEIATSEKEWILKTKKDLEECSESLEKLKANQAHVFQYTTPNKVFISLPSLGLSIE